ncbi:unnamed protein product [Rangifer tarandus platyrhynchus]|uniref:Uncharacterized protein n=1 Tax=Rangifer tarandus platyrhynchus TaxID=3082113 RepID=A0AC59Z5A9_RANTA
MRDGLAAQKSLVLDLSGLSQCRRNLFGKRCPGEYVSAKKIRDSSYLKYGGFCPPDPDAGARMGGHILWALPKARQGHTGASDQEPGPDPTPYVVPKRA